MSDITPHVSDIFPVSESPKDYAARIMRDVEAFTVGRTLSASELSVTEALFDLEVWKRLALGYRAMCLTLLEEQHVELLRRRRQAAGR